MLQAAMSAQAASAQRPDYRRKILHPYNAESIQQSNNSLGESVPDFYLCKKQARGTQGQKYHGFRNVALRQNR